MWFWHYTNHFRPLRWQSFYHAHRAIQSRRVGIRYAFVASDINRLDTWLEADDKVFPFDQKCREYSLYEKRFPQCARARLSVVYIMCNSFCSVFCLIDAFNFNIVQCRSVYIQFVFRVFCFLKQNKVLLIRVNCKHRK